MSREQERNMSVLTELSALDPSSKMLDVSARNRPTGRTVQNATASELGDLIFISLENWDEIWRRNQFICEELASRFPQSRIHFVGLPYDIFQSLRKLRLGQALRDLFRGPLAPPLRERPNLSISRPLKLFPNSSGLGRKGNERLFEAHVRRQARRLRMQAPLLWLNPHASGHLASKLDHRAVIYDITDDWALAEPHPHDRDVIRQQDAELCSKADLVIVCSEALRDSRRPLSRRLLLLPNGVDVGHYASVLSAPAARRWSKPVFGYTGTLHAERTDVNLILALAEAFPDGTVALVGPNFLPVADCNRLRAAGNVVQHGPAPYSEIPGLMAGFDVCIVPHRQSDFTESLNPIKLWEYLAAGKPIVSTDVAGFRSFANLCRISTGAVGFVAACRGAVDEAARLTAGEPGATSAARSRQNEAAAHTWRSRVDQLLKDLPGDHDGWTKTSGRRFVKPQWRPSIWRRALGAASRRIRLMSARLRHPRARFGHGCDVRRDLHLMLEGAGSATFGPNCVIDRSLSVECVGALRVGAGSIFGHHCTLAARESIEIGPDCLIAEMVSIRDHDHRFDRLDIPTRDQGSVCAPVRIGRNVWIGAKATVLKGVTIGDNAVIGCNAVVTRDIPANAVAVGIPAKVIRYRTDGGAP